MDSSLAEPPGSRQVRPAKIEYISIVEGGSDRTGADPGATPPFISPFAAAAGLGALWGSFGYSVLWDGRPFSVTRRFVVSIHGTVVLLPVRIVLFAIHVVERQVAGHPFSFENDSWWIGLSAAITGALLVSVAVLVGRAGWHVTRRPRRSGLPADPDPGPAAARGASHEGVVLPNQGEMHREGER
jgi:hypothetical protein